jgi:hypothetical protein
MSNYNVSGTSNRRNFLTGAAVAGAATIVVPTVKAQSASNNKKNRGIYADPKGSNTWDDKVADFSYTNDALAQLIVDIWLGHYTNLITPEKTSTVTPTPGEYKARSDAAKTVLAQRSILLDLPIVITEQEYVEGFKLADALSLVNDAEKIGVVFVVPGKIRVAGYLPTSSTSDPPPLLESAKALMAIVPNGI